MFWLLALAGGLAAAGPIIVDDMGDLCGPEGLATNCADAEGTWDDPYRIEAGSITDVEEGCGQRAAIAVCIEAVVEITGARVDVTSPWPAVLLASDTRLTDTHIQNGGGPAVRAQSNLSWTHGAASGIGAPVIEADQDAWFEGLEVTGDAVALVNVEGLLTVRNSTFHGGSNGIQAQGGIDVAGSQFYAIGPVNPRMMQLPVNASHAAAIEVLGGHALIRDSIFDVVDIGIKMSDGTTLDAYGNEFTGQSAARAIERGSSDDPTCSLRAHHNAIFGPTIHNDHRTCTLDARNNWWGNPDGPPRSFGGNVELEPWLKAPPGELPVVSVDTITVSGESFLIGGTATPGTTILRFTWPHGSRDAPASPTWSVRFETLPPDLRVAGCSASCGMAIDVGNAITAPAAGAVAPANPWWPWLAAPMGLAVVGGITVATQQTRARHLHQSIEGAVAADDGEVAQVRQDLHEFLAGAAHDLRGPIIHLVIATQVAAKRAADGEDISDLIEASAASGKRLQRLVDDLMTFGRAGYDDATTRTAPVSETIQDVVNTIIVGRTSIVLEGPDDAWTGDHAAVERIVQNLLSNAIRASPTGRICVRWSVNPFVIEVEDDANGIPEYIRDHLFQPLVRGAQGSGLGLATAARLAQRAGKTLSLVHTGGEGTCFRLA